MWVKASKLLSMDNAAPSDDKRARMALSFSGKIPHFVSSRSNEQYVCELCVFSAIQPRYGHTLAVAEINGELEEFLLWYITPGVSPNITVLGMEGLPKGRAGQKGETKKVHK